MYFYENQCKRNSDAAYYKKSTVSYIFILHMFLQISSSLVFYKMLTIITFPPNVASNMPFSCLAAPPKLCLDTNISYQI